MRRDFVEFIEHELSGSVGQRIAGLIGATPQATASGVGAAVPSVLGRLLQNSASPPAALELLERLLLGNHDASLSNLAGALSPGASSRSLMTTGTQLVSNIFGHRASAISSYVSNTAGLNAAASGGLLAIVTPLVLGFITRHLRTSGGLNLCSVRALLASQQNALKAAPAGLAGALGLSDVSHLPAGCSEPLPLPSLTARPARAHWLPWLAGLALLGVLVFVLRSFQLK